MTALAIPVIMQNHRAASAEDVGNLRHASTLDVEADSRLAFSDRLVCWEAIRC